MIIFGGGGDRRRYYNNNNNNNNNARCCRNRKFRVRQQIFLLLLILLMVFIFFNFSSFRLSSSSSSSSPSSLLLSSSKNNNNDNMISSSEPSTTSSSSSTTTTTMTKTKTKTKIKTPEDAEDDIVNTNDNDVDVDVDINFRGGIVGVLTAPQNYELRNKYRSTWMNMNMNMNRNYQPQEIRCYFLLDSMTTSQLELEQQTHKDIIFLNTKALGKGIKVGQKLAIFFQYIYTKYPNLLWIAKMDDDVALCPTTNKKIITTTTTTTTETTYSYPIIFDIIYEHYSPTLYLGGYQHGYRHSLNYQQQHDTTPNKNKNKNKTLINNNIQITSGKYRMDEMFVVLGSELISNIISQQRLICDRDRISRKDCITQNGLWDMNSGGRSIGLWLEELYSNSNNNNTNTNLNVVALNDYVVHYGKKDATKRIIPTASYEQICKKDGKLLYHKANITQMDAIWFGLDLGR